MSFEIGDSEFLLDGAPHRILSGALHYFRIHPDQWADRIHKARLMGLNTIETVVVWNWHMPAPGVWLDTEGRDLGRFLDLVAAEGMQAIVRPGPYICAEWTGGGLPFWLFRDPDVGVRRSEPRYLAAATDFLQRVYEVIVPRQVDRGGNVILVQIENEYGAYGSDAGYLRELVQVAREAGVTVPLITIDQPGDLGRGSLPELFKTASFGSRAVERLATLREHQPTGPLMCGEFWCGWFDWWGSTHHTTDAAAAARELDDLLAAGASVSIYVVHGGTNFGLTSGANDKWRYLPITTSYDYDAPLDEAGNPTAKYFAFREVLGRYTSLPDEVPATAAPLPQVEVPLEVVGSWLPDAADTTVHQLPPTFDALGLEGGLIRYEAELDPRWFADGPAVLSFDEVRDLAWVSVDGVRVGTLSRTRHDASVVLPAGRRLTVLLEEQGRVTYGPRIGEHKGLMGTPLVNGEPLLGWTATPVDPRSAWECAGRAGVGGSAVGPVALRGEFVLEAPSDLFLDTRGLAKGYAFVNGFLLGRYWANGPQQTLYVPAPVTRAGANTLVIAELEQTALAAVRFVPSAILGPTEE